MSAPVLCLRCVVLRLHPPSLRCRVLIVCVAHAITGVAFRFQFQKSAGQADDMTDVWLAYAAFHLSDFQRAADVRIGMVVGAVASVPCVLLLTGPRQLYKELLKRPNVQPDWHVNLGCCYFCLGMYPEADAAAQRGPRTPLQNRLLFHLSHKVG